MRISDWSSYVCSSDLEYHIVVMITSSPYALRERNKVRIRTQIVEAAMALLSENETADFSADDIAIRAEVGRATFFRYFDSKEAALVAAFYEQRLFALVDRSEEHTSELQSLMRISYSVFCLKKTKNQTPNK